MTHTTTSDTREDRMLKSHADFKLLENKSVFVVFQSRERHELLFRLCVGDLVDDQTNAALGNDVRDAIANLDSHHSMSGINAKHGEEVHHRVCAPADHCHDLCSLDLALNFWVRLTVRGFRQANKELVDDVQEEHHGDEPAHPARSQVASDDQLTIVARDDHEGR